VKLRQSRENKRCAGSGSSCFQAPDCSQQVAAQLGTRVRLDTARGSVCTTVDLLSTVTNHNIIAVSLFSNTSALVAAFETNTQRLQLTVFMFLQF
jgi:hypothetical protein